MMIVCVLPIIFFLPCHLAKLFILQIFFLAEWLALYM